MASPQAPTQPFEPKDLTNQEPIFRLPEEIWVSVLSTPHGFEPEYFLRVMENMIKNPNVTSSLVFRADVFYDSLNDTSVLEDAGNASKYTQHMKAEYRPVQCTAPDFQLQRTIVRQFIPRNQQLDKTLVQTCHILQSRDDGEEQNLVLMIPHVATPEEIPFYHPSVQALALLHTWSAAKQTGSLSIHFRLFPDKTLDNRLERTALNLLKIIHKHAVGQHAGYTKRVHHDLIVPQATFQNTYARLKAKYAKVLVEEWVEQTDPTKHVFEDLGIAAFLIELWEQMYEVSPLTNSSSEITTSGAKNGVSEGKRPFPGFVDIGCGNGVLVNILIQEGYNGWGFDARRRMTWSTFAPHVQDNLKEMILVPDIIGSSLKDLPFLNDPDSTPFHSGDFGKGTFIISNHADELTPWTPLLAYLLNSAFIAIPCCSHDLTGARCRFNTRDSDFTSRKTAQEGPGPSSGSLAKPKNTGAQPSAYHALTAYVAKLSMELGFKTEKEMLRIPSTRNAAIVGRPNLAKLGSDSDAARDQGDGGLEERQARVEGILRREIGDVEAAGSEWVHRAVRVSKSKGGH